MKRLLLLLILFCAVLPSLFPDVFRIIDKKNIYQGRTLEYINNYGTSEIKTFDKRKVLREHENFFYGEISEKSGLTSIREYYNGDGHIYKREHNFDDQTLHFKGYDRLVNLFNQQDKIILTSYYMGDEHIFDDYLSYLQQGERYKLLRLSYPSTVFENQFNQELKKEERVMVSEMVNNWGNSRGRSRVMVLELLEGVTMRKVHTLEKEHIEQMNRKRMKAENIEIPEYMIAIAENGKMYWIYCSEEMIKDLVPGSEILINFKILKGLGTAHFIVDSYRKEGELYSELLDDSSVREYRNSYKGRTIEYRYSKESNKDYYRAIKVMDKRGRLRELELFSSYELMQSTGIKSRKTVYHKNGKPERYITHYTHEMAYRKGATNSVELVDRNNRQLLLGFFYSGKLLFEDFPPFIQDTTMGESYYPLMRLFYLAGIFKNGSLPDSEGISTFTIDSRYSKARSLVTFANRIESLNEKDRAVLDYLAMIWDNDQAYQCS